MIPTEWWGAPSISGTHGQIHFWKFYVNYSCPWLRGMRMVKWAGWRLRETDGLHERWGNNTNNCPCARIRHDAIFNWCIELRGGMPSVLRNKKYCALKGKGGIDFLWCIYLIQLAHFWRAGEMSNVIRHNTSRRLSHFRVESLLLVLLKFFVGWIFSR